MAEAYLKAELQEAKNVQRLRQRLSLGPCERWGFLSLISLVPKWSGTDSTVTLEEFFTSIEAYARTGRWTESDQREIAALRLTGSARLFYQGCIELHAEDATWETFKSAFRRRYKDKHTDQYQYTKLQTARQGKNESPQEFADRCRSLAQKVKIKGDDPQIQRIHREDAERMLLASFVSGRAGVAARQVRFSCSRDLD
jgi:hypothetical protein